MSYSRESSFFTVSVVRDRFFLNASGVCMPYITQRLFYARRIQKIMYKLGNTRAGRFTASVAQKVLPRIFHGVNGNISPKTDLNVY